MTLNVVLTNDDGPPDDRESPYVFGLYQQLKSLGWNVRVVLPSSQKSWIGKAYQIKHVVKGVYYYPTLPDGAGTTSATSRPLREGEVAEWILLDGTPATCSNVALHNLFPDQIDLVISGPNLGRNSSSAFSLSSGTIGAALSSSLAGYRSIAISYGTVEYPTPKEYFQPAHVLGANIIKHIWENWGLDEGGTRAGEVDLYSVNIPLIDTILSDAGLQIYWTTMWRNNYGRLFKQIEQEEPAADPAGPDAPTTTEEPSDLVFKWSPDMENLIRPSRDSCPVGSDGWAVMKGYVSVTPLRASFAEPPSELVDKDVEEREWKVKL